MPLHEFIFVLGRIAHISIEITDSENQTISEKLRILFVEKLEMRPVEDPEEYIAKLQSNQAGGEADSDYALSEDEEDEGRMRIDDPQRILQEFL